MAGAPGGGAHHLLHPQRLQWMKKLREMFMRQVVYGDHRFCPGEGRLHILTMKNLRTYCSQQSRQRKAHAGNRVFRDRHRMKTRVSLDFLQGFRMNIEEGVLMVAFVQGQASQKLPK